LVSAPLGPPALAAARRRPAAAHPGTDGAARQVPGAAA